MAGAGRAAGEQAVALHTAQAAPAEDLPLAQHGPNPGSTLARAFFAAFHYSFMFVNNHQALTAELCVCVCVCLLFQAGSHNDCHVPLHACWLACNSSMWPCLWGLGREHGSDEARHHGCRSLR